MKGIYQLQPSLLKYSFTWDVSKLFEKYRKLLPKNQLDLKALTLETATVLALILMPTRSNYIYSRLEIYKKGQGYNTHCLSICVKA